MFRKIFNFIKSKLFVVILLLIFFIVLSILFWFWGSSISFRETLQINKVNFNQVMQKLDISSKFSVKNTLGTGAEELDINLKISSMKDFSPDSIARQIPELNKLIQLREALVALKGPMGNIPDFRKAVLTALKDKKTKEKLLLEIKEEIKE